MHSLQIFSIALPIAVAFAAPSPQLLPVGGALDAAHNFVKGDTSKGDVRSPCPALNALSNYGYL
jgi:hypothetical protein